MPYSSVHGVIADHLTGAVDGVTNSVTGSAPGPILHAVAGPLPALAALAAAAAAVVAFRARTGRSVPRARPTT